MDSKAEKALAEAKKIDVGDGWFEVVALPNDIFALKENGHIQEVSSFLIVGSQKALLFDTGMGISDISAVVQQLTDLEIIVVNSHTHFDHIGDDWRFPAIYVYADDYAVNVLTEGHSHWDVRYDSDPELFTKAYPPGFDPEKYSIRPVEKESIHLLHDGDIVDLGNRQMEVLHTPGHSHDNIMLLDRENRILLTGDTFCEFIFAFFDSTMPNYGVSNMKDYAQTMRDVTKYVPDLDYLYPSHGNPLADPHILIEVAKAFEKVMRGNAEYYHEMIYGKDRRVYEFDGFLIWTS
jgi:glyoxylase-like metal-dependent hydrolase (beta-lactamase superfamily II)